MVRYGVKRFLSHYSAALYWNIPNIDLVLKSDEDFFECTDYTYFHRSKRCFTKNQKAHICITPLPAGAIISKNNIYVASPELVFMQLAGKLDIHRLILLGLQLCSHSPGKASEAISTCQKLSDFVEKMKGHRGHRKAVQALKHIRNGSASIMESMAFMVLTLPNTLGGFGLGDPVFNYEIKLKGDYGKRLGQNRCYVDLYYKSDKVAVEYDSYAFHNSPSEQGKDALRAAILERHGITLMSMKTIQLYDKKACKDFADNLAVHIGKRIRIRTKKFELLNSELHKLLPIHTEIASES